MGRGLGVAWAVGGLVDVQRALSGEGLGEGAPTVALVVADMVAEQATSPLQARQEGWVEEDASAATSPPQPPQGKLSALRKKAQPRGAARGGWGFFTHVAWQLEWQGPISPLWKGWGNSEGQGILWEPARLGSCCPGSF